MAEQAKKTPFSVEKYVETVDNSMHRGCGKLAALLKLQKNGACAKPQKCSKIGKN